MDKMENEDIKQEQHKYRTGCGSVIAVFLTILFIVLKLLGAVKWKWVWVLCPLWIDIGFTIILIIFYFVSGGYKEDKAAQKDVSDEYDEYDDTEEE